MIGKNSLRHRTHYTVTGCGEPIIFIHGVGLDHTMWHHQVNYFKKEYHVYTYDMLGHGKSEKINQASCKLTDFVDQLLDFMHEMNIERAHIIGFSMGGMVAQLFSIVYPEKVRSLIIANAVANRTEEERERVLNRLQQVETYGAKSTIDAAINRWFSKRFITENKNTINDVKNRLKQNDEKSYIQAYRLFATADAYLWKCLEKITAPTLVITGEN